MHEDLTNDADAAGGLLTDSLGRAITYLRISVTDRCDLRCRYCMAEDVRFLPKQDVLTLEELEEIARCFVDLGVSKLRITGGEPLVRRNVLSLFRSLGGLPGLDELTLTTNGSRLAEFAIPLMEAGVRRVNVSLDTLDAEKFRALTRFGDLSRVLRGLDAAASAGLRVKINTVAIGGVNEDELGDLIAWAGSRGFEITLIEIMPMGELTPGLRLSQYRDLSAVRARLEERFTFTPDSHVSGGPARYWRCHETGGRVGFIAPMTNNFCASCNRVRLSCTGVLYPCLGQETASDLRMILRKDGHGSVSVRRAALEKEIRAVIARKPKGHDFALHLPLDVPPRADERAHKKGASREMAIGRAMHVTGG